MSETWGESNEPSDVNTTFFIEAKDWKPSVREALTAWIDKRENASE